MAQKLLNIFHNTLVVFIIIALLFSAYDNYGEFNCIIKAFVASLGIAYLIEINKKS